MGRIGPNSMLKPILCYLSPKILMFSCLLWRLETCTIGFGMPQTSKYGPKKFSPSICTTPRWKCWERLEICTYRFLGMLITMHYVRTLCYKYFLSYNGFSELPLTKNEKKDINLYREKVFGKAWISAHICFWVCWLQCTMLELCVTSMFWVMMVFFLDFWQEGLGLGFRNMVYG